MTKGRTITYRATNQKNGKWYVGSTIQEFSVRKKTHHKSEANDPFHNSLRKCPSNFVWEILSEVEGEDRSHEQEILDAFFGTRYCYNLSSRAVGMCPEIARRVGKKTKNFLGVGNLPHIRKLRSDLAKERHKKKNKEGKSDLASRMGKNAHSRRTPDGKSAIAVENSKHIAGKNKKKVEVTSPFGEVFIFESVALASKELNLNPSHLVKVCNEVRSHHKGYTARYLESM